MQFIYITIQVVLMDKFWFNSMIREWEIESGMWNVLEINNNYLNALQYIKKRILTYYYDVPKLFTQMNNLFI